LKQTFFLKKKLPKSDETKIVVITNNGKVPFINKTYVFEKRQNEKLLIEIIFFEKNETQQNNNSTS